MARLPLSERDLEIQAKRAAKSVTANLAEGFAKRFSEKEFKRFLLTHWPLIYLISSEPDPLQGLKNGLLGEKSYLSSSKFSLS